MTPGPEVLPNVAERKQEPLSLPRRSDTLHYPFWILVSL